MASRGCYAWRVLNLMPVVFRVSGVVSLLATLLFGCGGGQTPAYPGVMLSVSDVQVEVADARREQVTEYGERPPLYRNEQETLPLPFPVATFSDGARQRLAPLTTGSGPVLLLQTTVQRTDMTYYNDHRGDFIRWDVELLFAVEDQAGNVITRGKGGAWRELPIEEASEEEKHRELLATTLEAFDRYFADKAVLKRVARAIQVVPAGKRAHTDGVDAAK